MTLHNLFTITTKMEVFSERSPLKRLNKILEKYLRKRFIFSKVAGSRNEFKQPPEVFYTKSCS